MLFMVLCLVANIHTYAADTHTSYEMILNEINEEYGLELGYVPVDKSKISLEEYREKTTEFAIQQKELLDYINSQQVCKNVPLNRATGTYVNKTKTKDVSGTLGAYYSITAKYTVYDNKHISSYSSATLNTKAAAILNNVYLTDLTGPELVLINTTRTLSVSYTATIHYDSAYGYANTILYGEFDYDD